MLLLLLQLLLQSLLSFRTVIDLTSVGTVIDFSAVVAARVLLVNDVLLFVLEVYFLLYWRRHTFLSFAESIRLSEALDGVRSSLYWREGEYTLLCTRGEYLSLYWRGNTPLTSGGGISLSLLGGGIPLSLLEGEISLSLLEEEYPLLYSRENSLLCTGRNMLFSILEYWRGIIFSLPDGV